jgi:hypothetical protein
MPTARIDGRKRTQSTQRSLTADCIDERRSRKRCGQNIQKTGGGADWWGEATDELALARQSAVATARRGARGQELGCLEAEEGELVKMPLAGNSVSAIRPELFELSLGGKRLTLQPKKL